MSVSINSNVCSTNTKRFLEPSAASARSSSPSKPSTESVDSDTAEVSVSTVARQLQKGSDSRESNNIGTGSGSAPDPASVQNDAWWRDLASSTRYQILQQSSTAMLAQANNLPQQAWALVSD